MIVVSQDEKGLKGAMLELLEQELEPQLDADDVAQLSDEALADRAPASNYSPGYFVRIDYLLQLEGMIDAGAKLELFADEVTGLRAIKLARAEFAREHPACGNCGEAQYTRFARRCHACNTEFRKAG